MSTFLSGIPTFCIYFAYLLAITYSTGYLANIYLPRAGEIISIDSGAYVLGVTHTVMTVRDRPD